MEKNTQSLSFALRCSRISQFLLQRSKCKGQALVEFTLVFILMVVVAWIPADFGLAFYASQALGNAAREGSRLGSASVTLDSTALANIRTEVCKRLSMAPVSDPGGAGTSCSPTSNARVLIQQVAGSGSCNVKVQTTVQGNYNFTLYRILGWFGLSTPSFRTLTRTAEMRWEHQC